MATANQQSRDDAAHYTDEALRLYERYGKPLEPEHHGQYLAVSPDGQTLLGDDLLTVGKEAAERYGPDNVVFKIGDIAAGTLSPTERQERPHNSIVEQKAGRPQVEAPENTLPDGNSAELSAREQAEMFYRCVTERSDVRELLSLLAKK